MRMRLLIFGSNSTVRGKLLTLCAVGKIEMILWRYLAVLHLTTTSGMSGFQGFYLCNC